MHHQHVVKLHGFIGRTLDFHHVHALLFQVPLFLFDEEYRLAVGSEELELCEDDRLVDERQIDFVCFEHVRLAGLKHFLLVVHDQAL